MAEERHAIDEYVLRAARVSDRAAASLVDPQAKQDLLDRILGQPGPAPCVGSAGSGPRRPRLPRLALAGAAAGVVAVLAGGVAVLVALGGDGTPATDRPPAAAPEAAAGSAGNSVDSLELGGAMMDCAEVYSPAALAQRAFAFDGTVVEIAGRPAADDEDALYVEVTFQVEEWFHGGDAERFTVSMFPPDVVTSIENHTYQLGSRLLVTGEDRWERDRLDDPVAWYCGFSRTYSPAMADEWRQAFATD